MHYQYCTLTKTPLGYPAVVLSHGNPTSMVLVDWFLHTLQQVIDGEDVWLCQLKDLDVGRGGIEGEG